MPPACDTAATTSRQWLKARIGTSMPNISVIWVFMSCSLRGPGGLALLEVGGHAGLGFVAGEQSRREVGGPVERLVHGHRRHAVEELLGRGDGAGTPRQEVGDDGVDLGVEAVDGDGGVDQA